MELAKDTNTKNSLKHDKCRSTMRGRFALLKYVVFSVLYGVFKMPMPCKIMKLIAFCDNIIFMTDNSIQ